VILFDVNVLLNAHRPGQEHHDVARRLLETVVNAPAPFAISESVLAAFVRIATHPRAFVVPTPLVVALGFANSLLVRSNARVVRAGDRHWRIFEDLCRRTQAQGNLVADATHAALAVEHGCEWISFDRDFAKFPGLRWRHPLD
jgi:uncharacterized protein